MGWYRGLASATFAVFVAGCASVPAGMPSAASHLPDSRQLAAEPTGFTTFCLRFPDQCQTARPGAGNVLALDDRNWQLLNRINRTVNDAIWPEEDALHYGRAEYWTIPTDGRGDCDDYAVTKRKSLAEAGLPASSLRLAVVISPVVGRHAVLTVATDKGDFVLDNLTDDIVAWNATNFTWVERQDATNPMKWVALQPVMTAQARNEPVLTAKPDGATAAVPLVIPQADASATPTAVRTAGLVN